MRLAKITIKDFRGFPDQETVDLGGGKNLLLHGENGSGKSSLYHALLEFLNRDPQAKPFGWYRNIFSSGPNVSALDGFVRLDLSDGSTHEWRCLGPRPPHDPNQAQVTRE